MSKRLITSLTLVSMVAVLLLASGVASASTGAGTAATTSGLVAYGWAGPFTATFVNPSGSTTDASAVPGVDLSKPWGSLFELGAAGSTFGLGSGVACSTVVTNPASFSAGYQAYDYSSAFGTSPVNPVSGVYFDATCDDGSGYDFYRVRWDDTSGTPYPTGQPWPLFQDAEGGLGAFYWGSSVQDGGYHGTLTALDNGGDEASQITVYGHNASGFHFVTDGSGQVYPNGSNIVTTVAGN